MTSDADRTAYVIVDRRTGRKPSAPWSDAWDISPRYDPSVEDDPVFEQHAISYELDGDDDQDDKEIVTDGGDGGGAA